LRQNKQRVGFAGCITVRANNDLLEDVTILGASPEYFEIRNLNVATGRALTQADETHHSPICFLGADVAKRFFATVDPVGKTIRAGTHSYEFDYMGL